MTLDLTQLLYKRGINTCFSKRTMSMAEILDNEVDGNIFSSSQKLIEEIVAFYGGQDDTHKCKLISFIARNKAIYEKYKTAFDLYNSERHHIGAPPRERILRPALNDLGLIFPAIIADPLKFLGAWGIKLGAPNEMLETYMSQVVESKTPLFETWMVRKGKSYTAPALKTRNSSFILAEMLSIMHPITRINEYVNRNRSYITGSYVESAIKPGETT